MWWYHSTKTIELITYWIYINVRKDYTFWILQVNSLQIDQVRHFMLTEILVSIISPSLLDAYLSWLYLFDILVNLWELEILLWPFKNQKLQEEAICRTCTWLDLYEICYFVRFYFSQNYFFTVWGHIVESLEVRYCIISLKFM